MSKNKNQKQSGQAMIGSVLFVLVAGMLLMTGLVGPGVKNHRDAQSFGKSLNSFHLAESGLEDVLFRLKTGQIVDSEETLSIDGQSVTTLITGAGNSKTILSTGVFNDFFKKIQAKVTTGTGIAFNYGVQTGLGGLVLNNNASIIGNVYTGGDIVGSHGSYITGSAIAANSVSLTTDQENSNPSTPSASVVFRNGNTTQDIAQSFRVSTSSSPINKVDFYIKKVGAPSSATVYIKNDNSGSPGSTNLASGVLDSDLITTNYGWISVTFDSNPVLNEDTDYWLVIDSNSDHSSKYYVIGANADGYSQGVSKIRGRSWATTGVENKDIYFKLYLGGIYSTISGVTIGQDGVGIAHAHNVINSTISGNLYCQSGSGNNKACDTSQSDPVPQNWPVSDANIAFWKSEAEAGGELEGDYIASSTDSYLGPIKVNGDLHVTNNKNLILTGTVWVTGDILLDNNVVVSLDASYGDNSGLMVSDGVVTISNNGNFNTTGDGYVMVLTTSNADPAIDLQNNAGTVILNAQKGVINFSNNAAAKSITALKLVLEPNATIVYESGLANQNFVSGPSGGWNITSWMEVE